jgi:hypothetical protein
VVVVGVEADLLGVERLGAVDVRHGYRDELELPVHGGSFLGDAGIVGLPNILSVHTATDREEGAMHVRMARFEGVDVSRLDEDYAQYRKMVRSTERPEFIPEDVFQTLGDKIRRVISLADRENGVTVDLTFTDTAEDAGAVHEALDSLTPPEGSGRRTSAETFELMLDEQL